MVVFGSVEVILRMYLELIKSSQSGFSWEKDVELNDFEDKIQFRWGRIVIPRFSYITFLNLVMSFVCKMTHSGIIVIFGQSKYVGRTSMVHRA